MFYKEKIITQDKKINGKDRYEEEEKGKNIFKGMKERKPIVLTQYDHEN